MWQLPLCTWAMAKIAKLLFRALGMYYSDVCVSRVAARVPYGLWEYRVLKLYQDRESESESAHITA